jgi:hypothetical protein
MERFFGGNPLSVILKLALVCVVVGIVLAVLGYSPPDLLRSIPDLLHAFSNLLRAISEMGWGWVESAFNWFILGAIIVIPIWIIIRVLKFMSGDSGRASRP